MVKNLILQIIFNVTGHINDGLSHQKVKRPRKDGRSDDNQNIL